MNKFLFTVFTSFLAGIVTGNIIIQYSGGPVLIGIVTGSAAFLFVAFGLVLFLKPTRKGSTGPSVRGSG